MEYRYSRHSLFSVWNMSCYMLHSKCTVSLQVLAGVAIEEPLVRIEPAAIYPPLCMYVCVCMHVHILFLPTRALTDVLSNFINRFSAFISCYMYIWIWLYSQLIHTILSLSSVSSHFFLPISLSHLFSCVVSFFVFVFTTLVVRCVRVRTRRVICEKLHESSALH